MVFVAGGLLWFSHIAVNGSFLGDILGPSLLAAIGLGLGFVTSTIAAVSGVKPHEQGLASGLINTSQQIGGALGLAVLRRSRPRAPSCAGDRHRERSTRPDRGVPERVPRRLGDRAVGAILTLVLIRTRDSRAQLDPVQTAASPAQG